MGRNYKGISINTTNFTHEKVFSILDQEKTSVILDIPAGSGAFIQRLKDSGFTNVKAVDIENILEIEHEDFLVGDMTKTLAINDNSCDAVVCIDGIEHISNQFGFVREISRILKHQGEFVISTPNISSLRSRWKWLNTGHHHKCNSPLDENNPSPLHHIGMISFPEIRYLLHTNGFSVVEIKTNRYKPITWVYSLLLPFVFISTFWVYYRTGKRNKMETVNKSVFNMMFSKEVLFGETLIVKAVKNIADK